MPLRIYTDTPEIINKKIEEASKNSYVNYGIIAGFIDGNNYKKIPELAEMGIKGYKIFTARPYKPDERAYSHILDTIANVNGVAIIPDSSDFHPRTSKRKLEQSRGVTNNPQTSCKK